MKPLNILQIVPSISLVYGGPSQMVRGLSAALGKHAKVTIITTDSNGDVDEAPLDVPLGEPIPEDGYEVIYFRCSPFRRYKFSTALLRWLWANAHGYDIAHIHALFSPVSTSAATLCRWKKLPYIMRPLGTLDPADLQKKKQIKKTLRHPARAAKLSRSRCHPLHQRARGKSLRTLWRHHPRLGHSTGRCAPQLASA